MKVPRSTRLRLATVAAFLLFLGAGAQAPAASGDAVGPGCDPARPAVAYHAGSILGLRRLRRNTEIYRSPAL
jgi:hypothetical protein